MMKKLDKAIEVNENLLLLKEQVKNVIERGNYDIETSSESNSTNVGTDDQLDLCKNTAEEYFLNITDKKIEEYTKKNIKDFAPHPTNISNILTHIASENCDYSEDETMTISVSYPSFYEKQILETEKYMSFLRAERTSKN